MDLLADEHEGLVADGEINGELSADEMREPECVEGCSASGRVKVLRRWFY